MLVTSDLIWEDLIDLATLCHIKLFRSNEVFKLALTVSGEATFTVAGRAVEPGVTATVFIMVAPAGTFSTVAADEGGIFCVAAAAAARAAMPLI